MNAAIFTLSAVASAFAAVLLSGCVLVEGDDGLTITDDPCVRACSDHADVCGADFDCESVCADMAERGCEDAYEAHKSCLADEGVCASQESCLAEGDDLNACLSGE